MTWGRDTDEHEARDQLDPVRRGRRHPGRHCRRLRRRCRRAHLGSLLGDVVAARPGRGGDQGREPSWHGAALRRLARPPARGTRRFACDAWAPTTSTCGSCTRPTRSRAWTRRSAPWTTRCAVDASATWASRTSPGGRPLQFATWQRCCARPRAGRVHPDGVLVAATRRRTRGGAGRARPGCRTARLVAAGAWSAHREVPHRDPGRLPRCVGPLRVVRRPVPRRALTASRRSRRTAAEGLGVAPLEVALAWVRDRPG